MSEDTLQALTCPHTHTHTNVEEQDGPDRKSQRSQVALSVGTPLETDHQQVAKHHGAHLSGEEKIEGVLQDAIRRVKLV